RSPRPHWYAARRHRKRAPPPRQSVWRSSFCPGDFLQMPRRLQVGAAPLRKSNEESIEALDEANRVRIGMVGRQSRQPDRTAVAGTGTQHHGSLAAETGGELLQTGGGHIGGHEQQDRIMRRYQG